MPALRVRAGRSKSPVSFDRLQGPDQILLYERFRPTQIAPNCDVGVQVLGDLAGGRLSYAVGLLDGAPDGGSVSDDTDDRLEWVGRVFTHPFRGVVPALAGLGVGASASHGSAAATSSSPRLSAYRTTSRAASGDRPESALFTRVQLGP